MPLSYLEEPIVAQDPDILEAPHKILPPKSQTSSDRQLRYGTVGGGLDLMRLAWASEIQAFSMQDRQCQVQLEGRPQARRELKPRANCKPTVLNQNPVEVLMIDDGCSIKSCTPLERWLDSTKDSNLPKVIVVSGSAERSSKPVSIQWRKLRRKRMMKRGYQAVEWIGNSLEFGAALDQERLFDVYYQAESPLTRPPMQPEGQGLPPRSMSNLLMPTGIPKGDRAKKGGPKLVPSVPPPPDQPEGPRCVGICGSGKVYHPDGCMVDSLEGNWVSTEKGVRRIQPEELAKAKGLPSEWKSKDCKLSRAEVAQSTSAHLWIPVADAIGEWCCPQHSLEDETWSVAPTEASTLPGSLALDPATGEPLEEPPDGTDWEYDYPDLAFQGEWYQDRISKLKAAIEGHPERDKLFQDGLEALEFHRTNYTDEGPKYLQLLWWEFPEEHQEAVRLGSSMCFLVDPGTEIVPNSPMDEEQLATVDKFLDELITLGVLELSEKPLRRACPLFCVPKPGQPGEWRVIADMLRGGQNDCCSSEPIYLASHQDILPRMYAGGWTAIADMSKYFHNYLTLLEERDLMGVVHPVTGQHYSWSGLPMGSTNSPAISCRIGEGALELLRAENPLFHGRPHENTWRRALDGHKYDPQLGHGRLLLQDNGRPVAWVVAFVDDFAIHASTRDPRGL